MLKTNKCCKTSGYFMENIEKKVALMKRYPPAGDWCQIDKASKKVAMTYLLQNWDYSGERLGTVYYICPWGMKDTMTSLLSDKKCKNKPPLPSIIKDLIAEKPYHKDLMTLSITNTGLHAAHEYYRFSFRTCESDPELLNAMLQKHQNVLGPNPYAFTLIQNFDSLKINTDKIDFVSYFLPWDADVEAGPNARHFLRETPEHIDISHLYTKEVSSTAANKQKHQTKLIGPSSLTGFPQVFTFQNQGETRRFVEEFSNFRSEI